MLSNNDSLSFVCSLCHLSTLLYPDGFDGLSDEIDQTFLNDLPDTFDFLSSTNGLKIGNLMSIV